MKELADTVIYASLVASRLRRSLAKAVIEKFNAISVRESFPERLAAEQGKAIKSIEAERVAQDKQWGGAEHDDQHTAFDWVHYLSKQLDELQKYAGLLRNETEDMGIDMYTDDFKERLVKIAALSVAALESIERKGSAK